MPTFEFTAADAKGEQVSGSVEANDEAEAIAQIKSQNYYPLQVVEAGKGKIKKPKPAAKKKAKAPKSKDGPKGKGQTGGRIKPKQLMIFTRQLATLIDSGLPLLRSLTVLSNQEPNPMMRGTLLALADSVQSGSTFSEALAQHPKIFNKLFINMVKAGELGGVLEVVLTRLAEYQEKAQKLKNKIVSAMVYPVIVMFIAVGIMVFLMMVIVPKFKAMFEEMDNQDLPAISNIVFGTSEFMMASPVWIIPNAVWLIFLALFFGFLVSLWGRTVTGRSIIDNIKLRMPVFGDIQRKTAVARFSRTLGTLVTSGVPILQALNITRDTAGNVKISSAVESVHAAVKEGETVVAPLQASGVFPGMVISMVDVGEETGQLPEMLLKVADVYDEEVDNAVTALTSILEPIMIVILALIVGAVVFALFLPLLKVIQDVSQ